MRRQANGIVDLDRALTVSSDVFFYNVGLMYWQNYGRRDESNTDPNAPQYGMQRVAQMFGFGKSTGSGIAGETNGRIPTLQFKQELNANEADGATRLWLPGDSMNLAVGQGDVLVTPMQLAVAYAALANGGTIVTPRLAQESSRAAPPSGRPRRCVTFPSSRRTGSCSTPRSCRRSFRVWSVRCAPRREPPTGRSPTSRAARSSGRPGPPRFPTRSRTLRCSRWSRHRSSTPPIPTEAVRDRGRGGAGRVRRLGGCPDRAPRDDALQGDPDPPPVVLFPQTDRRGD